VIINKFNYTPISREIIGYYGGPTGYWTNIIGGRRFKGKKVLSSCDLAATHVEIKGNFAKEKINRCIESFIIQRIINGSN
jgi:hypothetical protein